VKIHSYNGIFNKILLGACIMCTSLTANADELRVGTHTASDVFKDSKVVDLLYALVRQNKNEANKLVASGVDVNAVGAQALTPLNWLLALHDNKAMEMLLDLGADPNKIVNLHDERGATPPIWGASVEGNQVALQLMLDHGGDPNLVFGNTSLLMNAVQEGHLDCAELLLQRGANINYATGLDAFFVVMTRVQYGNALWLLDHGFTHDLPTARRMVMRISARPGQEAVREEVLHKIDRLLAAH
jgi:hypothetical protein